MPKIARLGPPFLTLKIPRKSLCGSLFCVLSQEMRHINSFLEARNRAFWVGGKKFMLKKFMRCDAFSSPLLISYICMCHMISPSCWLPSKWRHLPPFGGCLQVEMSPQRVPAIITCLLFSTDSAGRALRMVDTASVACTDEKVYVFFPSPTLRIIWGYFLPCKLFVRGPNWGLFLYRRVPH